jgi:Concanavalin A-like lectin/glucanases superfamily
MMNDWQRMTASDWDAGEVEAQVDKWYHLAAEFGPDGLKLFVNGVLRASDPTFTGAPTPDWSDATLYGGWLSLGDNDTVLPAGGVPVASFKELRVSDYERYSEDFEPPDTMISDAHTLLLDHLIGGTTGEDHGMVWVP